MKETGLRNSAHGADKFGFKDLKEVHWNLGAPQLYEHAIAAGEATIVQGGPICAETGVHTGRSPKDKHTVCDALTEKSMWWDGNRKITAEQFQLLYEDFIAHARGKKLFAQDLYGGADPKYRIKTRVFTELAWHSLFIRQLLIRPNVVELEDFAPELTIVDLPTFKADPKRHGVRTDTIVAIDFTRKIVLIGNSSYAGEMKKSVFTTLNFYLPAQGVMPMHCSANVGKDDDVALFFGLSGTGKTTLSADPNRTLIGDDEHGWSPDGVFNFEGGCYAKCIKLSEEAEPEIYAATNRFGAVLENVIFDPDTRICDFDSDKRTENTRSAYPIEFMPLRLADRPRRAAEEHHLPHRRRLRRHAADREADAGAGDVSLPLRLHRQGRRHREGPGRRRARVLDLLRARRSCRGRRRNTATCCATSSASTTSTAGWSIPAGPAASTASAAACRSRRRARSSPARSTARSRTPATAPILISASRCRPRCPASSRICSIR